jgi:hypothetical protein
MPDEEKNININFGYTTKAKGKSKMYESQIQ